MHQLADHDRPREKLDRHGASVLGHNELLAVLIGHGRQGVDALAVANLIFATAGGLRGLTRVRREQLTTIPGVGPVQASRILAAIELGRRTMTTGEEERAQLASPRATARFLLPRFGAHPVERFGVLLLDTRHRVLAARLLSVGSLDASLAHPREVFREALLGGAAVVVAFHNHPSGDPTPSRDDVSLTERLKQAGAVVGVPLVDHLVLADDRYCSLREMGLF